MIIATDLTMQTGKQAFKKQRAYYDRSGIAYGLSKVKLHQSDNGSEFQCDFVEAVINSGSKHRYSRPYKKNEQSHIENFNKSLRSECFPKGDYEYETVEALQKQANDYCSWFITRRWHMGLPDCMTPNQFRDYYRNDPTGAKLALTTLQAKRYGKRKCRICG